MKRLSRGISILKNKKVTPQIGFALVNLKLKSIIHRAFWKIRDRFYSSFSPYDWAGIGFCFADLRKLFDDLFELDIDLFRGLSENYLQHRFDLLGSGWVTVGYGRRCRGMEHRYYPEGKKIEPDSLEVWLKDRLNPANVNESRRIWRMIGDQEYTPIDWQLDFKSGYRWNERTWYADIAYGLMPGVDIKVPWELARMQHLPQLAWAYQLAVGGAPGFEPPERYAREFRNQILDFIANNPPRWGVNWACSMDVAIRVSNWLIALDLFRGLGAEFDAEFLRVFARSVYEHGFHIVNNLEWSPLFRNNHYLANIVGLAFVAAWLPAGPDVNRWLAFAVRELIGEVEFQFHADGSNFEASTSYHRLSAEMVFYATALILGLPPEKQASLRSAQPVIPFYTGLICDRESPFPEWFFSRLEKMAEFTMYITRPDGLIPQIGDNDSGRFLKLFPCYHNMSVAEAKAAYLNLSSYNEMGDEAVYWMEEFLDHRHLVAAAQAFYDRDDFARFAGNSKNHETALVGILSRQAIIPGKSTSLAAKPPETGDFRHWQQVRESLSHLTPPPLVTRFTIHQGSLRTGITWRAFEDFGLYIVRSERLYLAIRCGSIGHGGHAHNDQLAIELMIDAQTIHRDPGTYVYTSLPEARNRYRSVKAHFAPRFGDCEPVDLSLGMFRLGDDPRCRVLYFGAAGFLGSHEGFGFPVFRHVEIQEQTVIVSDFSPSHSLSNTPPESLPFSPAYGVLLNPSVSSRSC